MISDSLNKASRSHIRNFTPAASAREGSRSNPKTSVPNPFMICANAVPIRPSPTTPTFFLYKSNPTNYTDTKFIVLVDCHRNCNWRPLAIYRSRLECGLDCTHHRALHQIHSSFTQIHVLSYSARRNYLPYSIPIFVT